MFGKKTCLAFLIGIAAIGYKAINKQESYRDNLSRWKEPSVPFRTPNPTDQSMLFKTVSEIPDPLEVSNGAEAIPDWLTGTLLRDGPGLFEFGDEVALHSFDGMAMIRRYHVDKGHSMNFSRKLIQSDVLQENRRQKRFTKYGVGTPVKGTPLDRLKARVVTNNIFHEVNIFNIRTIFWS